MGWTYMGSGWRPVAVMAIINLAFAGVNVVLKKVIDEGANHMVIVTYRLSISSLFLTPIAYYSERKTRPKLTACILLHLFFGALIGLTLTQYIFLLGLGYTSAAFSCAFLNIVPVSSFILSLPFGLEKVDIRNKVGKAKVIGALVCMSGAILMPIYRGMPLTNHHLQDTTTNLESSSDPKKTQRWVIGSIYLMAGCLMWSSWFPMQAKLSKKYSAKYSSTAIFTLFGAIQSALLSCILERDLSMWILKGKLVIIGVIFSTLMLMFLIVQGIVGSGLCYVALSWCVKQKGPVFTAAFTPFTQIFAAVFDFFILHEQIYLGSVLGSVLVVTGLYILLWGKSNEPEECTLKESNLTTGMDNSEHVLPVAIDSTTNDTHQ